MLTPQSQEASMQIVKTAAVLAAGMSIGALTSAVHSAPDHSLGMAMMSAIVDYQGTLVSGAGATAASRTSQGQYTVTFERDVSACSFAATSTFQSEMIGASADSAANVARVYSTFPMNGGGASASDSGFNLLVFCTK
jgi:hypothetical protein